MSKKRIIHTGLTVEKWSKFSLLEQLANVGTDVARAFKWKKEGDKEQHSQAFERALELIDFTVADPKNRKRLKEILRVREALVDHFLYDNVYNTTEESWQNYFYQFNYAAAIQAGK